MRIIRPDFAPVTFNVTESAIVDVFAVGYPKG